MVYIGHTSEDGRLQLLLDHLKGTSELCKNFSSEFGAGEWGELAGLYHDLGKYSAGFQQRILHNGPKVDHSTAGAVEITKLIKSGSLPLAFCIAGHHSGLANMGDEHVSLDDKSLYSRLKKGAKLTGKLDYHAYKDEVDSSNIKRPLTPRLNIFSDRCFGAYFFIRMLYSCLVDADYLDTEAFVLNYRVERGAFESIPQLTKKINAYIKNFWPPKTEINSKRCQILEECLKTAQKEPGLFTLTVPTGGGKTISSLAFALNHAVNYNKKRIIYVIPYISIIEQTAKIFENICGVDNVVQHHMNVNYDDDDGLGLNSKRKLATENWDAPLIVTTNVQFFESLYANRSSHCRKLHNLANSVIIFDEAQMLPNDYLKPCVRAITELVGNYGVTAVLCTATQPSLNSYFPDSLKPKEICSNVQELYAYFRRVTYIREKYMDISALVNALNKEEQVLCIVNSKKEAQEIFSKFTGANKFHLSTFMFPEHRRTTLKEIRTLLTEGKSCQVVATSLIEAGVDVDFPVVYRELAGLDNIIQAAGRCNREGKQNRTCSKVHIYELENTENKKMPSFLSLPIAITQNVLERFADIASIEAIKYYFDNLHFSKGDSLDQEEILKRIESGTFLFEDIAKDFKIIKADMHAILVPVDDKSQIIERELRSGVRERRLLRAMGQYVVSVYDQQYNKLVATNKIEQLDNNISVLKDLSCYDKQKGLMVNMQDGIGMFI